jgi:hypothetical protein
LDPESSTDNNDTSAVIGNDSLGISPAVSETHWKDTSTNLKTLKKGNKINLAMREDISMVMRRRAIKGYGIKNVSWSSE